MMPRNCDLLRASVRINGFSHVTVHQVAAAERAQTISYCHPRGSGNGTLASSYIRDLAQTGCFASPQTAQAVAVDDLLPPELRIHLVKMDVEGAEMGALRGMDRLFRTQRPTLVFEFYPHLLRNVGGVEPVELLDAIRSYGYEVRSIDGRGVPAAAQLNNDQAMALAASETQHEYIDLIAVPTGQ